MKTRQNALTVKTTVSVIMMIFLFLLVLPTAHAGMPKMDNEAALNRGERLFKSLCQTCHSLRYLGYEARMTMENARRAFGKAPPDLSLMARARSGNGGGYIYNLLVSFNDTPQRNSVFPQIAMPSPLDKADAEFTQKAKDISAFLLYAADPAASERTELGLYVIGYMAILTTLLYIINRRTWQGIKKRPS